MQRVSELVIEAQELRKDLAELNVSTDEQKESVRATQMRIGSAIDSLALDEARVTQELTSLSDAQHAASERLRAETEQVRALLRRKYWLTGPLAIFASNLRRGKDGTIGIEITPA